MLLRQLHFNSQAVNMLRWLVLAAVIAVGISESEVQPDVEPAAAANPINVHNYEDHDRHDHNRHDRNRHDRNRHDRNRHDHTDYQQNRQRNEQDRHNAKLNQYDHVKHNNNEHDKQNVPKVKHLLNAAQIVQTHGHLNEKKIKIIEDTYNPDYHQPTLIVDYRYLKSGGRDYTRGDGGRILILPKNVHSNEHKEFKNYDEFIEFLRLKNLAERESHLLHDPHRENYNNHNDQDNRHDYGNEEGLRYWKGDYSRKEY